jgi:hypothetical protein
MIRGLEGFAAVAHREGRSARAARLFGAAATRHKAVRAPLQPDWRAECDREIDAVRQALAPEVFAAEWAQGGMLTLEQAVAFALEEGADA